jgi:hypothetical protein
MFPADPCLGIFSLERSPGKPCYGSSGPLPASALPLEKLAAAILDVERDQRRLPVMAMDHVGGKTDLLKKLKRLETKIGKPLEVVRIIPERIAVKPGAKIHVVLDKKTRTFSPRSVMS